MALALQCFTSYTTNMALLSRFDTPASVRDLPLGSPFYNQWSNYLSNMIGPTLPGDGGGAWYNPSTTDVQIAGERGMVWMGFPRQVLLSNRDNRQAAFAAADSSPSNRNPQNEYFEWKVERNKENQITKLTFVTETPEYYQQLWSFDPNRVLQLYRNLVDPGIHLQDLETFPGSGAYNKFNDWNTTKGIVHYIQTINTLSAAVGLARGSRTTPPPHRDNYETTSHANPTTAVDPRVQLDVHMLVRKGLHVSLRDPIGFYMTAWNDAGFEKPDGNPAGNYWKIVRGTPGMVMRLEYEVPPALGFVVGDMRIGGRPIEYGGQVAEHITVNIFGVAGTVKGARV